MTTFWQLLAAILLLTSAIANAAIYKCNDGGKVVYSDSPCAQKAQRDSGRIDQSPAIAIGSQNSGAGLSETERAQVTQRSADNEARRLQRLKEDHTYSLINEKKVAIGMTADDVKASWGAPTVINSTLGSGGRSEQWVYRHEGHNDQYVYLQNGTVTSIQSPTH